MWKATNIFSAKNIYVIAIFQDKHFHIMLANNFVKFWTIGPWYFSYFSLWVLIRQFRWTWNVKPYFLWKIKHKIEMTSAATVISTFRDKYFSYFSRTIYWVLIRSTWLWASNYNIHFCRKIRKICIFNTLPIYALFSTLKDCFREREKMASIGWHDICLFTQNDYHIYPKYSIFGHLSPYHYCLKNIHCTTSCCV